MRKWRRAKEQEQEYKRRKKENKELYERKKRVGLEK